MAGAKTAEKQSLTTAEAAAYLGYAPKTLYNWRSRGIGPECFGRRSATRYPLAALKAYRDANTR